MFLSVFKCLDSSAVRLGCVHICISLWSCFICDVGARCKKSRSVPLQSAQFCPSGLQQVYHHLIKHSARRDLLPLPDSASCRKWELESKMCGNIPHPTQQSRCASGRVCTQFNWFCLGSLESAAPEKKTNVPGGWAPINLPLPCVRSLNSLLSLVAFVLNHHTAIHMSTT